MTIPLRSLDGGSDARRQRLAELSEALKSPFPPGEEQYRVGNTWERDGKQFGRVLTYIDARAVFDRLDAVVGPGNWSSELIPVERTAGAYLCRLTVLGVTKTDVGQAGADEGEKEKSGASDAIKRAAVQFGIGRYLYELDLPPAQLEPAGKGGKWQLPRGYKPPARQQAPAAKEKKSAPPAPVAPPPPPPASPPPLPAEKPAAPPPPPAAEAPAQLPELAKGSKGPLSVHGLTLADKEMLADCAQEYGLAQKAMGLWLRFRYGCKQGFVDLTQKQYADALQVLPKYGAPITSDQMRNLHGVAKDYGFDHDALHQLAQEKMDLASLADARLFHYECLLQELLPREAKKAAQAKAGAR